MLYIVVTLHPYTAYLKTATNSQFRYANGNTPNAIQALLSFQSLITLRYTQDRADSLIIIPNSIRLMNSAIFDLTKNKLHAPTIKCSPAYIYNHYKSL